MTTNQLVILKLFCENESPSGELFDDENDTELMPGCSGRTNQDIFPTKSHVKGMIGVSKGKGQSRSRFRDTGEKIDLILQTILDLVLAQIQEMMSCFLKLLYVMKIAGEEKREQRKLDTGSHLRYGL